MVGGARANTWWPAEGAAMAWLEVLILKLRVDVSETDRHHKTVAGDFC